MSPHCALLQNMSLSVNDLLACCGFLCGAGCNGGYPIYAWRYFMHHGVVTEQVRNILSFFFLLPRYISSLQIYLKCFSFCFGFIEVGWCLCLKYSIIDFSICSVTLTLIQMAVHILVVNQHIQLRSVIGSA